MRILIASLLLSLASSVHASESTSFKTIDVYLDSEEPFAAWQFTLADRNSLMRVVGVENGESPVFSATPYYDRDAVASGTADRIIVADFSLAQREQLPSGRVRIATVHVMLAGDGEPDFDLQLVTATTEDGHIVDAVISLESDTGSTR